MSVTDTTSTVRTYTVGDAVPEELRVPMGDWCEAPVGRSYVCSLRTGHTGPQHLAWHSGGSEILAAADRDTSGDEVASTTVEGTWKAGDVVQRTGFGVRIPVATVVGVERDDDGITWAHVVGRYSPDGDWQHMRVQASELRPNTDASGPTHEQIAEAMVSGFRQAQTLIRQAQRDRDRAQEQYGVLSVTHSTFRDEVRSLAIEKAAELGWCRPGLNEALDQLGLDRATNRYRVTVEVTAVRTVDVEVDAADGDAAWQAVDAMDPSELRDAMEAYGESPYDFYGSDEWDHSSHDASSNTYQLD